MSEFVDVEEPTGGPVLIEAPRETETEAPDPEAPYGRFKNGKPRKAPVGSKPGRGGGPKAPRAAAAPRPRSTSSSAPRRAAQPDFRSVVAEAMSLASIPLMGMGRVNRAFLADAAAVQIAAEPFSHAVNEVAKINPGVARVLSSTAPAFPYVLLGSALFNLGAQIMANHGKHLPIPGVAIADPESLAQGIEAQMVEAMRQQQEDEAREHQYAQEDEAEAQAAREAMRASQWPAA